MPFDAGKMRRFDRAVDAGRMRIKDDDDRKIVDDVFDGKTLSVLNKMLSDGVMASLDYPIATGKEGKVFRATGTDGELMAVKIYCVSNATFRCISNYITADPRFRGVEKNKGKLIHTWAKKEFKNLSRLHVHGLKVPKPLANRANIIVMGYIGTQVSPAPTLKRAGTERPEAVFKEISEFMRVQHRKARLVHGDLSEYNILMLDDEPYVIDVGQAVTLDHPMAKTWLLRDVANVCRYFSSLGVDADKQTLYDSIVPGAADSEGGD